MRPRLFAAAVATLSLVACTASPERRQDPNPLGLLGTVPVAPLEKVDFTLPDTRGRDYHFRAETDGHITLLFFGYTFCPDICPVHMATLSAALRDLPEEIRDQVRTVFVTVDPARDTPERLQGWLQAFDSSFVGIVPTDEEVAEVLSFYRYPPPETSGDEVGYTVGHPALIYAFTPDDLGRAMYGPETPKNTWVHDLTAMAGHDWAEGAPGPDPAEEASAAAARAGDVLILDPMIPRPPTATTTAFYFTLRNVGETADTLVAIESDLAQRTSLHDMVMKDGVMRMQPMAGGIPLAPGATVRLEPGARHGMLEELRELPEPGATVTVRFRFARAGLVEVPVRVVRYEDVGR